MIDYKKNLEEKINYLTEKLNKEEFQKEIVKCLKGGAKEFTLSRQKENNPIQSYVSSTGIERAKKIGDKLCNNENFNDMGIKADVMLSQGIPVIILGDIMFTIKSLKDSNNITKNKPDYIKKYSKLNRKLNPQISMIDISEEGNDYFKCNYYGVIVYHISNASTLDFVKFIFLDENAKEIVLEINVKEDIINSEEKIMHKNSELISKENIKDQSLKKLIRIK